MLDITPAVLITPNVTLWFIPVMHVQAPFLKICIVLFEAHTFRTKSVVMPIDVVFFHHLRNSVEHIVDELSTCGIGIAMNGGEE